jgi:hypothetical protein
MTARRWRAQPLARGGGGSAQRNGMCGLRETWKDTARPSRLKRTTFAVLSRDIVSDGWSTPPHMPRAAEGVLCVCRRCANSRAHTMITCALPPPAAAAPAWPLVPPLLLAPGKLSGWCGRALRLSVPSCNSWLSCGRNLRSTATDMSRLVTCVVDVVCVCYGFVCYADRTAVTGSGWRVAASEGRSATPRDTHAPALR